MSKKSPRGATSTPTSKAVSSTSTNSKSSILKSSFAPSKFQLALFASVIQGFESQHLRFHDTVTGRLRCEHAAGPGTRITSLDWGYYGATYREESQSSSKKKRKRDEASARNVVLAFGTSQSEIQIFSPTEAKIVVKLGGVHERGIKDFRFSVSKDNEAWSIGGDGKLVRWDLKTHQATKTMTLPDPSTSCLASPSEAQPSVLCASSTPFSIDFTNGDEPQIKSFNSFKHPVQAILRSGIGLKADSETFLAADSDRYMNVYQLSDQQLVKTLIVGSEVETIDLYTSTEHGKNPLSQQVLATVTRAGEVELFMRPFSQPEDLNGDIKAKRKNQTAKSSAKIRVVSSDAKSKTINVFSASLQGPDVVLAITEGGVKVSFQKIRWQDEGNGELLFEGVKQVQYIRSASNLNTATMNGVKDLGKSHVDESKTVVVNGAAGSSQHETIEILSSDDEEGGAEEDSGEDDNGETATRAVNAEPVEISDDESDTEMADAAVVLAADLVEPVAVTDAKDQHENEEKEQDDEPTFGELLAARQSDPISISDALQANSTALMTKNGNKSLNLTSGMSLATVLSQSLRTNDQNLLESCLHTMDTDIVRLTIQRLDSSLAGILLQKLSERLASRPGRYRHLLQWVQWTCIAHGAVVASNPEVVSKVKNLYHVLTERSKALESLLLLKGKLDMLDAQQQFRRQLEQQRGPRKDPFDEPGTIYIEGQADNWDSDDEDDAATAGPSRLVTGKKPKPTLDDLIDSEDSDDEDMPMTNGMLHADDDIEDDEDEFDEAGHAFTSNGPLDIEAEEEEDSHPSDNAEESSEESETSEEADSAMADFIDDGSSVSDVEVEDATPDKPATKKARRA